MNRRDDSRRRRDSRSRGGYYNYGGSRSFLNNRRGRDSRARGRRRDSRDRSRGRHDKGGGGGRYDDRYNDRYDDRYNDRYDDRNNDRHDSENANKIPVSMLMGGGKSNSISSANAAGIGVPSLPTAGGRLSNPLSFVPTPSTMIPAVISSAGVPRNSGGNNSGGINSLGQVRHGKLSLNYDKKASEDMEAHVNNDFQGVIVEWTGYLGRIGYLNCLTDPALLVSEKSTVFFAKPFCKRVPGNKLGVGTRVVFSLRYGDKFDSAGKRQIKAFELGEPSRRLIARKFLRDESDFPNNPIPPPVGIDISTSFAKTPNGEDGQYLHYDEFNTRYLVSGTGLDATESIMRMRSVDALWELAEVEPDPVRYILPTDLVGTEIQALGRSCTLNQLVAAVGPRRAEEIWGRSVSDFDPGQPIAGGGGVLAPPQKVADIYPQGSLAMLGGAGTSTIPGMGAAGMPNMTMPAGTGIAVPGMPNLPPLPTTTPILANNLGSATKFANNVPPPPPAPAFDPHALPSAGQ